MEKQTFKRGDLAKIYFTDKDIHNRAVKGIGNKWVEEKTVLVLYRHSLPGVGAGAHLCTIWDGKKVMEYALCWPIEAE